MMPNGSMFSSVVAVVSQCSNKDLSNCNVTVMQVLDKLRCTNTSSDCDEQVVAMSFTVVAWEIISCLNGDPRVIA